MGLIRTGRCWFVLIAVLGPLGFRAQVSAEGPSVFRAANAPREAIDHLRIFSPVGIQAFAVTPNGGWALVTRDGRIAMEGTPPGFGEELRACVERGHRILSFAFTNAGGWTLFTDQAYLNSKTGVPPACLRRQNELAATGGKLLAVAYGRGDDWVVTSDRGGLYTSVGGPDFQKRVGSFIRSGPIRVVALSPQGGGSALIDGRRYDTKNLPRECFKAIEEATVAGYGVDSLALLPNDGWVIITSRPKE